MAEIENEITVFRQIQKGVPAARGRPVCTRAPVATSLHL